MMSPRKSPSKTRTRFLQPHMEKALEALKDPIYTGAM
jgi:hypothetical protein